MTYDEQIAIIQAAKAGKVIQRFTDFEGWVPWTYSTFDFCSNKYRVKPEPKRCWCLFRNDDDRTPVSVSSVKREGWIEMVEAME